MYTVKIRYYSRDEGLLLWKTYRKVRTYFEAVHEANRLMARQGYLLPCDYPSEKIPCYKAVHGRNDGGVLIQDPNPCNIQVRKDGKLVAWRNI